MLRVASSIIFHARNMELSVVGLVTGVSKDVHKTSQSTVWCLPFVGKLIEGDVARLDSVAVNGLKNGLPMGSVELSVLLDLLSECVEGARPEHFDWDQDASSSG